MGLLSYRVKFDRELKRRSEKKLAEALCFLHGLRDHDFCVALFPANLDSHIVRGATQEEVDGGPRKRQLANLDPLQPRWKLRLDEPDLASRRIDNQAEASL